MADLFGLTQPAVPPNDFLPRNNIAPAQRAPVVREQHGRRECVMLKWGLIPFWSKDAKIAHKTINARVETVATAPAFREAWRARRCLVPTGGFYEWQKGPGAKQPYCIGFKDGRMFALAGLWDRWTDRAGGETVETFTIITGPPNEVAGKIHNRMPVIQRTCCARIRARRCKPTRSARPLIRRPSMSPACCIRSTSKGCPPGDHGLAPLSALSAAETRDRYMQRGILLLPQP